MSRPPLARESVLDAFESILIDKGERFATLDATAKAAGVSKGGLLYHFASKDALATGMLERLDALVREDVDAIASAPEGPVAYFLRSSITSGTPVDRAIVAATRLAQGGDAASNAALRGIRRQWAELIRPHVADPSALDLVLLVSDGLYYNAALDGDGVAGPVPQGEALNALIALVERAARP